ncbi:MAG: universal stress protein [Actinophytocola sp.]|uniref:universal stress protein n=1 Tax=Actinophytocola sp. TaxID=1872138 RepID=UPI003C78DFFC
MNQPIVAGVSLSGARPPMVRWAAAEAASRGAGLRLVTAYSGTGRDAVTRRLAEVAAVVAETWPGLEVHTESVAGQPAAVLRDAAADAGLLVVGADDASPFTEAIVGSVPGALLTTTPCPLVVAPRREWTTPESAPVVVAMDGLETALAALDYAFAAAARSGRSLTVLRGLPADPAESGMILARFGERSGGVDVTTDLSRGDTAGALVAVSRSAAQLVLGSHGRGRHAPGLFGSVSRTLIRGAGCPVVVARATDEEVGRGASSYAHRAS